MVGADLTGKMRMPDFYTEIQIGHWSRKHCREDGQKRRCSVNAKYSQVITTYFYDCYIRRGLPSTYLVTTHAVSTTGHGSHETLA